MRYLIFLPFWCTRFMELLAPQAGLGKMDRTYDNNAAEQDYGLCGPYWLGVDLADLPEYWFGSEGESYVGFLLDQRGREGFADGENENSILFFSVGVDGLVSFLDNNLFNEAYI